jgi:prepilin-type N-terminal cleavage/methylation domain-containing protein
MKEKGFSLIELIVAVVVLGMILVVVYSVFFYQEKTLRRQRQWSELNMKGRKASTYIAKEIRLIGCSRKIFGGSHSFGIVSGAADSIVYLHDVDGMWPGEVDAGDIHSIYMSGDTLYIDGDFACNNVTSLEFIYTDVTGATAALPVSEVNALGEWILVGNQIRDIEYTLELQNPSPIFPDVVVYSGVVSLRNRP